MNNIAVQAGRQQTLLVKMMIDLYICHKVGLETKIVVAFSTNYKKAFTCCFSTVVRMTSLPPEKELTRRPVNGNITWMTKCRGRHLLYLRGSCRRMGKLYQFRVFSFFLFTPCFAGSAQRKLLSQLYEPEMRFPTIIHWVNWPKALVTCKRYDKWDITSQYAAHNDT